MNHIFFIHSSVDGHLGCCHVLAIINSAEMNIGVHASFSDSVEWRDRVFTGIIEHAGRDNLVINDKENGKNYLILMIYLDFVEFDEEITYAK